jgi:hypothetical protein
MRAQGAGGIGRASNEEGRVMASVTDVLQQIVEQAVEAGIRRAMNADAATYRRLLSPNPA